MTNPFPAPPPRLGAGLPATGTAQPSTLATTAKWNC
jgi:hypothetical protein